MESDVFVPVPDRGSFQDSREAPARPGRSCPVAYRYGAASLARAPGIEAEVVYVAGGLYGNPEALDALLALHAAEPAARLVFNGDFNWFDRDDATFERINRTVLAHHALRGNVETELLSADAAAGCGCGYPDYVSDADVERSNRIMDELARTARRHPALTARLAALPMTLVARIGGERIGIVHGDADSLAGWSFGEEAIDAARVMSMFEAAQVRVFASSHTCLPVAQVFATTRGDCLLVNNGAAGMANFAGTTYGVVTRIGTTPAPAGTPVLYGGVVAGLHVDAIALHFDIEKWLGRFDRDWPAGSPAALSYRHRIVHGPRHELSQAVRAGTTLSDNASVAMELT
jgi:hypothetical protein